MKLKIVNDKLDDCFYISQMDGETTEDFRDRIKYKECGIRGWNLDDCHSEKIDE